MVSDDADVLTIATDILMVYYCYTTGSTIGPTTAHKANSHW